MPKLIVQVLKKIHFYKKRKNVLPLIYLVIVF